jgi:hypothetical protein
MQTSRHWFRRVILWSAVAATATATALAATAAQAANPTHASHSHGTSGKKSTGPGYPRPKGIYYPFTDCPLVNPLMQESIPGSTTGCISGIARSGSIKIGNITTPITKTVNAQFGIWAPPNAGSNEFTGGTLAPPDGLAGQLVSPPELVPGGLLKALGCPSTNSRIEPICTEAQQKGGKYLQVYAEAESLAPVTNFELESWTQEVQFQLINPLLGSYCTIGSASNPVIINPSISFTREPLFETDPNPTAHPDTGVIVIRDATASDTTFAAPGVIGCGPGGEHNITFDQAIDKSVGLPAASGSNSLTLNGYFYLGASAAPDYMANVLLSAFKASAAAKSSAVPAGRPITSSILRQLGFSRAEIARLEHH